jgi:hypothetical protein
MFTAILLVTVFVVDEETAVDPSTVLFVVGSVNVVSAAAAPAVSVTDPPPVPLIAIGMSKKLLLGYAADDIPR